jgi:hypothetical protein
LLEFRVYRVTDARRVRPRGGLIVSSASTTINRSGPVAENILEEWLNLSASLAPLSTHATSAAASALVARFLNSGALMYPS